MFMIWNCKRAGSRCQRAAPDGEVERGKKKDLPAVRFPES